MNNQFDIELDKVERFLKKSTEDYDDFDGEELVVFLNDKVIERYSRLDLIESWIL